MQPGSVVRLSLIQQLNVKFAIAIHLAARLPDLPDELGLAGIFPGPFAQRGLEPGIEAAAVGAQAAALLHCGLCWATNAYLTLYP